MSDTANFVSLMRQYNQRVFRACRSVLRDDAEAEDAAQEAWVLAWRHLDEVRDPARIGTWVTRIAIREAIARARKVGRLAITDEDVEDTMQRSPEKLASDREMGRLIEGALDELSEQFRTVFVLRMVEGMSVADTAEALEIPEETVKTRLHRARRRVADQLVSRLDGATREVYSFDGERCDRIVSAVLRRIS
jgi:RNA polymerase sigma-70 factor (ECF subfamily)